MIHPLETNLNASCTRDMQNEDPICARWWVTALSVKDFYKEAKACQTLQHLSHPSSCTIVLPIENNANDPTSAYFAERTFFARTARLAHSSHHLEGGPAACSGAFQVFDGSTSRIQEEMTSRRDQGTVICAWKGREDPGKTGQSTSICVG